MMPLEEERLVLNLTVLVLHLACGRLFGGAQRQSERIQGLLADSFRLPGLYSRYWFILELPNHVPEMLWFRRCTIDAQYPESCRLVEMKER